MTKAARAGEVEVIDLAQREHQEAANRALLRDFLPTQIAWENGGRELCTEAVQSHARSAVHHMCEVGRWLAYAREQLQHGEYYQFLDSIGVDRTNAWRSIQMATRLAGSNLIDGLSKSKAVALLGLGDDQIAELEAGGVIGALRAGNLERMTTAELRAEVSRLTQQMDRGREQIAKRDARIAGLETKVEDLTDEAARLRREAAQAPEFARAVTVVLRSLREMGKVIEQEKEKGSEIPSGYATSMLAEIQQSLSHLREVHPDIFNLLAIATGNTEAA